MGRPRPRSTFTAPKMTSTSPQRTIQGQRWILSHKLASCCHGLSQDSGQDHEVEQLALHGQNPCCSWYGLQNCWLTTWSKIIEASHAHSWRSSSCYCSLIVCKINYRYIV